MAISIAFEGPEAAGKSTQVRLMGYLLKETGLPVLPVREPGGTEAGEDIREILQNRAYSSELEPITNIFLYSASRVELINKVILPWMKRNPHGVSLSDRCWWSTRVFQATDGAQDEFIRLTQKPFEKLWPDVVVLIDLPVEESIIRLEVARRLGAREINWRDNQISVFEAVRRRYLELAQEYREKCFLVDGFKLPGDIALVLMDSLHQRMVNLEGSNVSPEWNQLPKTIERITHGMKSWNASLEVSGRVLRPHELAPLEEEVRMELGFPSKPELRQKMHEEWQKLGLESPQIRLERE